MFWWRIIRRSKWRDAMERQRLYTDTWGSE
jgi:hypothetical protein